MLSEKGVLADLNPKPYTLNATPYALNPKPYKGLGLRAFGPAGALWTGVPDSFVFSSSDPTFKSLYKPFSKSEEVSLIIHQFYDLYESLYKPLRASINL